MEIKRPFPKTDWLATPELVRNYIEEQEGTIFGLGSNFGHVEGGRIRSLLLRGLIYPV